jgi:CHAT domain-containing protein
MTTYNGDPVIISSFLNDDGNLLQELNEWMQDRDIRDRLYKEMISLGGQDIGISKPLQWKEYHVEGSKEFEQIYPLSPRQQDLLKDYDVTFNELDQQTQFCVLFSDWVYYELQGNLALASNRLEEAKILFEDCLNRAVQVAINILKARSITGLLGIAEKHGDRSAQRKYIEEARKYYQGTGDTYELKLEEKLAMLEMDEGKLIQAEKLLRNVLQKVHLPKNVQEANLFKDCLLDLATVKRFKNEWSVTLEILDQCERESKTMPELPQKLYMTSVYFIRAKIYSTRFASIYNLDRAQECMERLKETGYQNWVVDELESDIAFKRKDWKKALNTSLHVIAELEKAGWAQGIAAKRIQVVNSFIELGDLMEAEKELMKAIAHFKTYGPLDLYAHAIRSWAVLESKKGNSEAGWEKVLQTLEVVENLIHFHNSLLAQQLFLLDKLEYYEVAFDIALSAGGDVGVLRAWEIAERSKSFYICQLVANSDVALYEDVKTEYLLEMQRLEVMLDEVEIKMKPNAGNIVQIRELVSQQSKIYKQKQALLEQIMQENPRWAAIKKPARIDIKNEYEALGGKWSFLSYYWRNGVDRELYIFYFDRNGRACCHLENWSKEEWDLFMKKREIMLKPGEKEAFNNLMPSRIAEKIFPLEVLNNLADNSILLISPHETFRGLPLHMFQVKADTKLVNLFPVQYIPTFSLLGLQKQDENKQNKALFLGCSKNGFGDSELIDVPDELNSLASIWKGKGSDTFVALIGPNETPAMKGFPLHNWNDYRLLHIACHGIFPSDEPMSSALRLGKEAVRGSELFGCKLNADVVSLSACELGRQKANTDDGVDFNAVGDEWIGIYLPMFYAGVNHLLVSLWTANTEQTPAFMKAFNLSLADDQLPAVAFKNACREMDGKPNSFWGNWYIVGFPSLKRTE